MGLRSVFRSVTLLVYIHLAFCVLMQVENFFLYLKPTSPKVAAFLSKIFVRQAENLSFSLALGTLYLLCFRFRVTRWLYMLISACANFYLVINQVMYKTMYGPLSTSMSEKVNVKTLVTLAGSWFAECDRTFVVNCVVYLVVMRATYEAVFARHHGPGHGGGGSSSSRHTSQRKRLDPLQDRLPPSQQPASEVITAFWPHEPRAILITTVTLLVFFSVNTFIAGATMSPTSDFDNLEKHPVLSLGIGAMVRVSQPRDPSMISQQPPNINYLDDALGDDDDDDDDVDDDIGDDGDNTSVTRAGSTGGKRQGSTAASKGKKRGSKGTSGTSTSGSIVDHKRAGNEDSYLQKQDTLVDAVNTQRKKEERESLIARLEAHLGRRLVKPGHKENNKVTQAHDLGRHVDQHHGAEPSGGDDGSSSGSSGGSSSSSDSSGAAAARASRKGPNDVTNSQPQARPLHPPPSQLDKQGGIQGGVDQTVPDDVHTKLVNPESLARAKRSVHTHRMYKPIHATSQDDKWYQEVKKFVESKVGNEKMRKKNILLYVLESVGTKQLFNVKDPHHPQVDPTLTPSIQALKSMSRSILFPFIYTVFPATLRSHFAMQTGGAAVTWGSVTDEFWPEYQGPRMAQHLADEGYSTSLFAASDLSFENMANFLEKSGMQHFWHYGPASSDYKKKHFLNSWGGDDEGMIDMAEQYLQRKQHPQSPDKDKPFFMSLLPLAAHHPYSTKLNAAPNLSGDNRKRAYRECVHYADKVFGDAIKMLQRQGVLQDTIVVLTGDHGEAFAEWHDKNMLHNNALYNENLQTFLMLFDDISSSSSSGRGQVVSRPAAMADVMPTVLSLVPVEQPKLPPFFGQNLLSPKYRTRNTFFFKLAHPPQYGMVDGGQWKFIANLEDLASAELYDLVQDPHEQVNVASKYPKRIKKYLRRCRQWYLQGTCEFSRYLKDSGITATNKANIQKACAPIDKSSGGLTHSAKGPISAFIGYKDQSQKFVSFANNKVHPSTRVITVQVYWHRSLHPFDVYWVFRDPNGHEALANKFRMETRWDITWFTFYPPQGPSTGDWSFEIWDATRTRQLLQQTFAFDPKAPRPRRITASSMTKLDVGSLSSDMQVFTSYDNQVAQPRTDTKLICLEISWKPAPVDFTVLHIFKGPQGENHSFEYTIKAGWGKSWFYYRPNHAISAGTWTVALMLKDGTVFGEKKFTVYA